jgi:serine/threonine protein phosphatase PrpC
LDQDHARQTKTTRNFMGGDRHVGGRTHQQDHLVCLTTPDLRRQFLVVADGVGGHWGGEMAAQAVIETAKNMFPASLDELASPAEFLRAFCTQAGLEIQLRAAQEGEQAYSTVVALLTDGARAYWAHVGDSRLYCFRDEILLHQTQDHSLVQSLFEQGKITAEERATHPDRNKVLSALGMASGVQPTLGEMTLTPDLKFLLCTDGFWAQVGVPEMPAILAATDLDFAASIWVRQAARRGGSQSDNIALALWRPPTRTHKGWSLFR